MLEYFTYKKVKKHQAEKRARDSQPASPAIPAAPAPVLSKEDENFLGRIVSEEGERPPLPNRPTSLTEAGDFTTNQSQMTVHDGRVNTEAEHEHKHGFRHKDKGKGKEEEGDGKEAKKGGKFAFLQRTFTKKVCTFEHQDIRQLTQVRTRNSTPSQLSPRTKLKPRKMT